MGAHDGDLVGSIHPAAHSGAGDGRMLKLQRDAVALGLNRVHLPQHSLTSIPACAHLLAIARHADLAMPTLLRSQTTRGPAVAP